MAPLIRPDGSLESGFHAVFTCQQRITAVIASPPRKPLIGAGFDQALDCSRGRGAAQGLGRRHHGDFVKHEKTRTRRVSLAYFEYQYSLKREFHETAPLAHRYSQGRRFNHASGTGTMQIFISRPSAASMADWIWILRPSGLKVGCGWSRAVVL